jgi:hypothetical protein
VPFGSTISPASGSISPAIMRSSVDFPAPFIPVSPMQVRSAANQFTPSRIRWPRNVLLRLEMVSTKLQL